MKSQIHRVKQKNKHLLLKKKKMLKLGGGGKRGQSIGVSEGG